MSWHERSRRYVLAETHITTVSTTKDALSDEDDWACDLAPLTITPPPAPSADASGGGAGAGAVTTRSMAEVDAVVAR